MDNLFPPDGIERAASTSAVSIDRAAVSHRGATVPGGAAEARGYLLRSPPCGALCLQRRGGVQRARRDAADPAPALAEVEIGGVRWRQLGHIEWARHLNDMVRFDSAGEKISPAARLNEIPATAAAAIAEHMSISGHRVFVKHRAADRSSRGS